MMDAVSPVHGNLLPRDSTFVSGSDGTSLRTFSFVYNLKQNRKRVNSRNPLFCLVIYLKSRSRVLGVIALFRPRNSPNFSSRDQTKAELMAPHLAGAFEKTIVLEQIIRDQGIINSIAGDLPYRGIMVLDESLEPIFMDENAVKMMSWFCQGQGYLEISSFGLPKEISTCSQELKASTYLMESAELHQQ